MGKIIIILIIIATIYYLFRSDKKENNDNNENEFVQCENCKKAYRIIAVSCMQKATFPRQNIATDCAMLSIVSCIPCVYK